MLTHDDIFDILSRFIAKLQNFLIAPSKFIENCDRKTE